MNLINVLTNIREAREELERLDDVLGEDEMPHVELEIGLRHAYHHLNVAWNTRHVAPERFAMMTDEDLTEWGKFPPDLLL